MKRTSIICFIGGALLFGSIGVFAGQYIATENPFPVKLNGQNIELEGYNINDNTYFKLRDIADAVGGIDVDFQDNTIQLSKNGYIYDNGSVKKIEFTDELKNYLAEYGIRIPVFNQSNINNSRFAETFTFCYYTGIGDPNGSQYHNGYFNWDESIVREQYKLLFGMDMPIYHPQYSGYPYQNVIYDNNSYMVAASNYGDERYVFDSYEETSVGLTLSYLIASSTNDDLGYAKFDIEYANNKNGYIITAKHISSYSFDDAVRFVSAAEDTQTAAFLSETDTSFFLAPCSYENAENMSDSNGHVSSATIVYEFNKTSGECKRVQ